MFKLTENTRPSTQIPQRTNLLSASLIQSNMSTAAIKVNQSHYRSPQQRSPLSRLTLIYKQLRCHLKNSLRPLPKEKRRRRRAALDGRRERRRRRNSRRSGRV